MSLFRCWVTGGNVRKGPVKATHIHATQEYPMNRIAAVALILSISCAGGVVFAGAVTPMVIGKIAVSSATDMSVIEVKGTSKSKTSTASKSMTALKPKPAAPRPSLHSDPDYDNVLCLGNYFTGN
jgi:hypothetical protein